MNIEKIKNRIELNKNKEIKFRFNGNRNQIEEFEGVIMDIYKCVFLIKIKKTGVIRSYSYSDILIGNLEVNLK